MNCDCNIGTAGDHAWDCPNALRANTWAIPLQHGWICPRCQTVNAPHINKCDCPSAPGWNYITTPGGGIRQYYVQP